MKLLRVATVSAAVAAALFTAAAPAVAAAPATSATSAKMLVAGCSERGQQHQTIRRGSRGAAVRHLQCLINKRWRVVKDAPVTVDGVFGPATERAVRQIQRIGSRQAGVKLKVDGIVGPKTWKFIHSGSWD
ncbi:hypothetical protein GCM10012275_14540 [Longimycelium tulufanense]|uniref:Peptidoglycan binding-like domain-containing protein n=1 Tax=Longimycelium tulufanense TaxID=907463 RepID=A0A8J3FT04_9PSEU|nr:peptidoglycan-binding domain-containing protein [Longimycelium tulufanense]GGM44603.1 hypothetical protein GCM10012275_14540 [Longimycelium tulufanense]